VSTSPGSHPRLTAVTVPIDDIGPLVPYLDPHDPLLFVRRGHGIAGIGEAVRLEFRGPTRIADAAAAWRGILGSASVVDPLELPGTGPVAFGSFAFSEHTAATSVLIVPSVVIGRHGGATWVTRITANGDDSAAPGDAALAGGTEKQSRASVYTTGVPRAVPFGPEFSVTFEPGLMTPAAFEGAVDAAIARIEGGQVSKVVLARELIGTLPRGGDVRHVLAELEAGYPDCFTFAVNGLIGSSPETLVRVDRGSVSARVLAGSMARGGDAATDQSAAIELATSTKDLDEHGYALRSVLAALAPHSANLATTELPFTLKLPNLWHLASDVEGTLGDGSTSLDLVAALHPTAAVAGAPTAVALEVIRDLEPFDRGRYAGPVGWVGSNGDGEWAVALRCAHVSQSGRVTAYAGSGIVTGSVAARELAETRMKFRPIVEAFS
jgi:menaquinone-specific isochorismate synthase